MAGDKSGSIAAMQGSGRRSSRRDLFHTHMVVQGCKVLAFVHTRVLAAIEGKVLPEEDTLELRNMQACGGMLAKSGEIDLARGVSIRLLCKFPWCRKEH